MHGWIGVTRKSTPLVFVDRAGFPALGETLSAPARHWCSSNGFAGENGRSLGLPLADGGVDAVLVGCDPVNPYEALAALPRRLAGGDYRLDPRGLVLDPFEAALAWAQGAYRFDRYRKPPETSARLAVDATTTARATPLASAVARVRDLVNTPTEDLGPAELAAALHGLADAHGARYEEWSGAKLAEACPAIHAVGRASHREPRLAMLEHGDAALPHVVLVGKGVCFDSGGLDLKNAEGMRWMKKDMGGAAHAIALAGLILETGLPVHLCVLVPAVENSVSANAYRPGEVIVTRAGISVEVDNTDAEGRLILCDALALAGERQPDLILDFATLTGAARVALGPDLPALFSNRDEVSRGLLDAAHASGDPLWPMPLWRPYLTLLESHVADIANSGSSRHAGAITAALFLERFVPPACAWAHLDVYAWNDRDRPGHPRGGEAQGLRACLGYLDGRYRAAS
jgi:leucyl aminopeptidase